MSATSLTGTRILLVEDETLVALDLESMLADAGCEVIGPVPSVAAAVAKLDCQAVDGALLDVNLGKETVYPLADRLRQRGVPYVFLTGYGSETLPDIHRDRPLVLKPFDPRKVLSTLAFSLSHPD
ncbi:MAG: response regulator [Geminicoccaceae bacterium]